MNSIYIKNKFRNSFTIDRNDYHIVAKCQLADGRRRMNDINKKRGLKAPLSILQLLLKAPVIMPLQHILTDLLKGQLRV